MKSFELDYLLVNTIKKSVDMGINPLEAIEEAYKLQKDYKKSVNYPCTDEDIKKYLINGLNIWYTLR